MAKIIATLLGLVFMEISAHENSPGLPRDIVTCNTSQDLSLACPEDTVVTAEIYGAYVDANSVITLTEDGCPLTEGDCLASPALILSDIEECTWKESSCDFPFSQDKLGFLRDPCINPGRNIDYMVAKNFQCVPKRKIFDVCSSDGLELDLESGYITSPNYPNNFQPNLDCTMGVHVPSGMSFHIDVISSDLPSGTCGSNVTITQITSLPEVTSPEEHTMCHAVNHTHRGNPGWGRTLNFFEEGQARLRFVTGSKNNNYVGFALQFKRQPMPPNVSREPVKSPTTAHNTVSDGGCSYSLAHAHSLLLGILATFAFIISVMT